jgi:CRP-like cAMP-binding protein
MPYGIAAKTINGLKAWRNWNTRARKIAVLESGAHFGEGSVLTPGGRRTASIKAETALDLITLRQDDFRKLAENLDAFKKVMRRSIDARHSYAGLIELLRSRPTPGLRSVAELMSAPVDVFHHRKSGPTS